MILTTSIIAIVIGGLAFRFGGELVRQGRVLRSQQEFLSFCEPSGTVVYDENPGSVERLLKDPHYYRRVYRGTIAGPDYNAAARQNKLVGVGGSMVVFLHGLDSPAGERLISLNCTVENAEALGSGRVIVFRCAALTLATWHPGSNRRGVGYATLRIEDLEPGDRVRIEAGEPDPTDASKFTVHLAVNGKPRVLEGKLQDDGTTLTLNIK